jgi:hypothetical protein
MKYDVINIFFPTKPKQNQKFKFIYGNNYNTILFNILSLVQKIK